MKNGLDFLDFIRKLFFELSFIMEIDVQWGLFMYSHDFTNIFLTKYFEFLFQPH